MVAAAVERISAGIPDWVNWLGLFATFAGLLVSLVGLRATYLQAKQAKTAAEATSTVALEAIKRLQDRNSLSNLSVISKLQTIREYIRSTNISAARSAFDSCAREIKEVFYHFNPSDDGDARQAIDRSLMLIGELLDQEQPDLDSRNKLVKVIGEIANTMSSEEAKRRVVP